MYNLKLQVFEKVYLDLIEFRFGQLGGYLFVLFQNIAFMKYQVVLTVIKENLNAASDSI